LITIGGYAKWIKSDDYPYGAELDEAEQWFHQVENEWGGPIAIDFTTPSLSNDEKHRQWTAKFYRSSASKADAIAMLRMNADIDLRAVLPSINVPTLVLQAKDDFTNSLESGRDLASRIPNAKLVEMDCKDHVPWGDCSEVIIREIQDFLGEEEFGDEKWSDLLEGHHEAVRRELEIFRGHEVKTTGDGFHATFDGPARSVQCAVAIRESTRRLGLNVRIGIHTGECEVRGQSLEGVAIHMAARVSGMAAGGEILVSRTVKDLVAGSGIEFEDFGTQ
jgi:hypothetical protein